MSAVDLAHLAAPLLSGVSALTQSAISAKIRQAGIARIQVGDELRFRTMAAPLQGVVRVAELARQVMHANALDPCGGDELGFVRRDGPVAHGAREHEIDVITDDWGGRHGREFARCAVDAHAHLLHPDLASRAEGGPQQVRSQAGRCHG